jgi:hypothetical protein
MIDYARLDRSLNFYEEAGFKRIELPWTVTKAISGITKPLLPLIEGKGGGKPDQIQGSGKPSKFNEFILELKRALA